MKQIIEIMLSLIRYEVFGQEIASEIKSKIDCEILPQLYKLSKKHDLAHLMSNALYENGYDFSDNEYLKKFQTEQITAIYRYEQQNFELQRIINLFEENKIPFIPLKGAVIRKYYPEPWMRTSCDIDILVKEEDLEKAKELLVSKLNYIYKITSEHDVEFFSQSGMHFELHFKLSEEGAISVAEVWENAYLKNDSQYEYLLSDEFFLLYHLIHMKKHFINGGCGVKPFIDLHIINKNINYDEGEVTRLCQERNSKIFFEKMLMLTGIWFENGSNDDLTLSLQEYVFTGGVYGNFVNRIAVKQRKAGSRAKAIFIRIFPPIDYLRKTFNKAEMTRWQYPYYAIKRSLRVFNKKKYKKAAYELKVNNSLSKSESEKIDDIFDFVGL